MAENLLASMDQSHSQVAAIVTGGFHSQGLSRQLQDRGVTVITYAPKVSKIEDETGSAYLSVFTQEKTPARQIVRGRKIIFVAVGRAAARRCGTNGRVERTTGQSASGKR